MYDLTWLSFFYLTYGYLKFCLFNCAIIFFSNSALVSYDDFGLIRLVASETF
jgi:hypothetical protein